jgi:hypothetical protein
MAELIPRFLFSSQKDKRYFLFHPNVELIPTFPIEGCKGSNGIPGEQLIIIWC